MLFPNLTDDDAQTVTDNRIFFKSFQKLPAVRLSSKNRNTLLYTWNLALFKIFKMNDSHNLLYAQYCCDILPITYAIDLRRMLFVNKLRCHLLSTINVIYDISIHSDYTQICTKYSVAGCSKEQCRVSVKRAFIKNIEL